MLGLTQESLAFEAGVSRGTVQNAENGKDVSVAVLESLAAAIDFTYDEVVDDRSDAFSDWPWKLYQYLKPPLLPKTDAFCEDQADALAAINRMRTQWGNHLRRTEPSPQNQELFCADRLLTEEIDQYQERYLKIWKKNSSTFLFAVHQGIRVGLCFVLPVTDVAFDRILRGEISFMDISAEDVLAQSQNIVLDSAVEFENASRKSWYQLTDDLSFAIFHSIASLSVSPIHRSFRMLGFGASDTNMDRLQAVGFKATGTKMPKYGYEICSFAGDCSDLEIEPDDKVATLGHYATRLKRIIPSQPLLRSKRSLISVALQTYKSLAVRATSNSVVA